MIKLPGALLIFLLLMTSCSESPRKHVSTITVKDTTMESAEPDSFQIPKPKINMDSINKTNDSIITAAKGYTTKAEISEVDSSFSLFTNKRKDHRIFGFEAPSKNAKKLILFSIFTGDVSGNPFNLPLGAYYDMKNTPTLLFRYLQKLPGFIKVLCTDQRSGKSTILYFDINDVEF
ncbi:MAG: hypothetical protein IM581_04165 [Chitinophagaceae bacterium]|jgi:hypothetical protein|nr:hypothetical protein [Chitinophagaceae bacterium]